jgi:hypothetical protein
LLLAADISRSDSQEVVWGGTGAEFAFSGLILLLDAATVLLDGTEAGVVLVVPVVEAVLFESTIIK